MDEASELLLNIERIHTTEMGVERIKRNLAIETDDIVSWCKARINESDLIYRKGKNFYIEVSDFILTVNSYSYTIITAHKKKIYK